MSTRQPHRNSPHQKISESDLLPTTPIDGGNNYARDARRAATTSKATRKTRILSAVVKNNNQNTRKFPSSPDWDSQITLTQLVPKTETPDDDAEDAGRDEIEVIDLEEDDHKGISYKSTSRVSPNSIQTTTFKRRKSVSIRGGIRKATKPLKVRNERNIKQKGKNGNKTLTQMDFVRRYIPLPESDDDDLKLYDGTLTGTNHDAADTQEDHSNTVHLLTPRKRRKLDGTSPTSPILTKCSPSDQKTEALLRNSPKTPQRIYKFEIPSSQTPETPRQKTIPSPASRKPCRLSLADQPSSAEKRNQLQSPTAWDQWEPLTGQKSSSATNDSAAEVLNDEVLAPILTSNSQLPPISKEQGASLSESDAKIPPMQPLEPPPMLQKKRAIVYDTDEDTDYGELDDETLPQPSLGTEMPHICLDKNDDSNEYHHIANAVDSDDLPPIPNSGTDLEINANTMSDPPLASESSVYYRRPAQLTQYPNEPVPILNTQKIAELFPIEEKEESDDYFLSLVDKMPPAPGNTSSADPRPDLCSQSETTTQDEYADRSIQIVPESSPVTRHDEIKPATGTMAPPARESIVLVESSQLVDRLSRQSESSHPGASLRRLFSTGEFLTDSVMETIPPPPWMMSQDSVGEPYSETDRDCI